MEGFRLEEYRAISQAILDLDGRIVRVYGIIAAATIPLLGVVAAGLARVAPFTDSATYLFSWLSLVPCFAILAGLHFQVALRRDMARLGMYRLVFFEEDTSYGLRWETALSELRTELVEPETNDPIATTYACIAFASVTLFTCGICLYGLPYRVELVALVVPCWLGRNLHRAWGGVYPGDVDRYRTAWRAVKTKLLAPTPAR